MDNKSLARISRALSKINRLMNELKRMAEIDKLDWDAEIQSMQVLKLAETERSGNVTKSDDQYDMAEVIRQNEERKKREAAHRKANNVRTLKSYKIKDK